MGRKNIFLTTLGILGFIWLVHLGQIEGVINTDRFVTKKENGVVSIITGALMHYDYNHLISNSKVLLVTIPLLLLLYHNYKYKVLILGLLIPSIFCFFINLPVLGISGLVYTILWFLIFAGIGEKDNIKFVTSIVLIIMYSHTLLGITPAVGAFIAWQSHLVGFLLGLCLAWFRHFK